MQVIPSAIPDVLIFEPTVFGDDRGYFFESFRQDFFEEHVGQVAFVQENESKSAYGVLRGLHFQKPPFTQSKLVRVLHGRVLDVAVQAVAAACDGVAVGGVDELHRGHLVHRQRAGLV